MTPRLTRAPTTPNPPHLAPSHPMWRIRSARTALIFSPPVMNRVERQTADCQTVLTAMRVRHIAPDVFAIVGMHEGSKCVSSRECK